jgi:large subunit ribosomal protein L35
MNVPSGHGFPRWLPRRRSSQRLPESLDFAPRIGKIAALMPKMKTKSGAKKRFKVTGTGRFKRSQKGKRHILTKKSQKRKRQLRGTTMVHETQEHQIRAMLPHA